MELAHVIVLSMFLASGVTLELLILQAKRG